MAQILNVLSSVDWSIYAERKPCSEQEIDSTL